MINLASKFEERREIWKLSPQNKEVKVLQNPYSPRGLECLFSIKNVQGQLMKREHHASSKGEDYE